MVLRLARENVPHCLCADDEENVEAELEAELEQREEAEWRMEEREEMQEPLAGRKATPAMSRIEARRVSRKLSLS